MQALKRFTEFYTHLTLDKLNQLDEIYGSDIEFIDPVTKVHGLDALTRYFFRVLEGTTHCRFDIHKINAIGPNDAVIEWTMQFAHKQLNKGQAIEVDGVSVLRLNEDKITYHRDYYDMGAMLYEHVPLFGKLVSWLKARLAH